VLPDGGAVTAGWINSRGAGGDDVWVMRVDGEGNQVWGEYGKQFGGTAEDRAKTVVVLPDGDVVVLAETLRDPPSRVARLGLGDPIAKSWLLRLSRDGEMRRERLIGSEDEARSDSLDVALPLADGGFILTGFTESKGVGQKDGWLVRTDGDFTVLWDAPFGEPLDDEFSALATMPDGGFVVAGATAARPEGARARPGRDFEMRIWIARLGYK
jgi:hypothetical protein